MLHCRFWKDLNVLRKNFWEKFPEKLPSEVSITNFMVNWDKLQLSWNNIDVLGCILPNKANEIAILNSRRFIQIPIEPWDSVHEDLVRSVFIFVCVCYLFIEQWDSVHKDLVRSVVLFASVFVYWAVEFCPQGSSDNVLFLLASIFECDACS